MSSQLVSNLPTTKAGALRQSEVRPTLYGLVRILLFLVCGALAGAFAARAQPRLYSQETDRFRVIYYSPAHEYLAPLLIRSLENAARFDRATFGYRPKGKVTVLIQDFQDFGYGSAGTLPANFIQIGIAPFNLVFETLPAAERMGLMANHELIHIVIGDKPARRDSLFRTFFGGKILPNTEDPVSIGFSFLSSPRQYSPRWYHEGAATFMETWMGGGLGRGLGGYDEMVFRALERDHRYIYEVVGLESEGTAADFQVGANSYLYGTRFMNYLAKQYGPDKLLAWMTRSDSSRAYFESQFRQVYGASLRDEWRRWIVAERAWQEANLATIRRYPVTLAEPISPKALGSVSRSYFDPKAGVIYAAVRHPGRMPYLAAIHPGTGKVEHLTGVRGGALYYVSSLAFDPQGQRLFYTTNNNYLRTLNVFDLRTRKSSILARNLRVGDLVYNQKDGSLWGMRHADGLSSIVRMEAPFRAPRILHTFPYAVDFFDLDLSPDGEQLTGALADETGTQKLVGFRTAALMSRNAAYEVLQEFQFNSPGSFAFSPDGRYLYGSSYYTGASNLFRYDLETRKLEALSNTETGLFRPVPLPDGTMAAFEYTAQGFRAVKVPVKVIEDVNAIPYLGQSVVQKYAELKSWKLPSRAEINDLELRTYAGEYRPWRSMRLQSMYPIIQGYKDAPAGGMRFDFADGVGLSRASATLSFSPDASLPLRDRFHLGLEANYWNWSLSAYFNKAGFYDLFGPTKVSRRGFGVIGEKRKTLIYESQRRLDLTLNLAGYSGLDRLPEYQNIVASHSRFLSGTAALHYSDLERSLGAIEDEKGTAWNVNTRLNYTGPKAFPRIWAGYDRGFLLLLKNSPVWIRSSAGKAFGDPNDPFSNFYFGGFGNNWIDKADFSRYREYYSFPGVHLNQLGGSSFAKSTVEWNLPPVRFRNLGTTAFYSNWARLSLFSGVLGSNLGSGARRGYVDAGAQIDFRLVFFTYAKSTFSTGFAAARDRRGHTGTEVMFSLKIY